MIDFLSCDLETAGKLNPRHGPIDQIGFGAEDGRVFREHYQESHRDKYQRHLSRCPTVFHNAPFDVDWLEYNNYVVGDFDCTLHAAHLLHSDLPLGLDFINSLYTHLAPWWGKTKKNKDFSDDNYHAMDLYSTALIWPQMRLRMKAEGFWSLYQNETKPVIRTCIDLKRKGVKLDTNLMTQMTVAFGMQIDKIDKVLNAKFPTVNWASSPQVCELLYDVMHLPTQYNGDSRTVDADALEELLAQTGNPIIKLLLVRRGYDKMLSTYTTHEVDENGFFHFDLQFTTSTGRARGFVLTLPKGRMRSLFIPDEPGWKIAYLDWAQVELWISAIQSGDLQMQKVLRDTNIHEFIGSMAYAKQVKKGMPEYQETKFIDHGTNYGRGAKSISLAHEIPLERVNKVLKWLETSFPGWFAYRKAQKEQADRDGYLTNAFGFTRYFWSGNTAGMAYANEPQSDVAHMMKRVLIQIHSELPKPARLMFPFHDAVAITYPEEMESETLKVAEGIMRQQFPELRNHSFDVDVGTGSNLQEASE